MGKFEKILAFYSIIAITTLLIGSVSFLPRPQNFLMLALFFPIAIYFWFRVTNPGEVNMSKWSLRLLLMLFVLSTLGIFGYSLAVKTPGGQNPLKDQPAVESAQVQDVLSEEQLNLYEDIQTIKDDVEQIKLTLSARNLSSALDTDLAEILGSETKSPTGTITPKDETAQINVYEEPVSTSTIIGKIQGGKTYSYYEIKGTWYLIDFEDSKQGWVKGDLFKPSTQ